LQVTVAMVDPLPFGLPHGQGQVPALGPVAALLEVAGHRPVGSAGWADQDDVDTRQEIPRRLGPAAAGVRHEDHPAQIDAEFGRGGDPRIGQTDRGAPAPGL
jgi:hypothetical protein